MVLLVISGSGHFVEAICVHCKKKQTCISLTYIYYTLQAFFCPMSQTLNAEKTQFFAVTESKMLTFRS